MGQDLAGGIILPGGNFRVLVGSIPAAVIGDAVVPHGTGPHAGPVMVLGSFRVMAGGRPVCRQGDTASCGDAATGSATVKAS